MLNFDDPRSKLFFEYVRILKELREGNPNIFFLLENVKMLKSHEDVITRELGVNPIFINSSLVSAQSRQRLYWTNINQKAQGLFGDMFTDIPQPKDKGILLKHILQPEVDQKYYISQTALDRVNKKHPKINPDKSYAIVANNNTSSFGNDRSATLIASVIDKNGVRDIGDKSTCLDANYWKGFDNHGQRYVVRDVDGDVKRRQDKSGCLTAGAHSGGNHSDMDLIEVISQEPRGNNKGGLFEEKSPTLTANSFEQNNHVKCVRMIGRNPENPKSRKSALPTEQMIEQRLDDKTGALTTVQKDNMVQHRTNIRRLTEIECCRLQNVDDDYFFKSDGQVISSTQIYKCLGNGWTIDVICHILSYLKT